MEESFPTTPVTVLRCTALGLGIDSSVGEGARERARQSASLGLTEPSTQFDFFFPVFFLAALRWAGEALARCHADDYQRKGGFSWPCVGRVGWRAMLFDALLCTALLCSEVEGRVIRDSTRRHYGALLPRFASGRALRLGG